MEHKRNPVLLFAAIAVIAGFFLPWLMMPSAIPPVSAYDMLKGNFLPSDINPLIYLGWLIPVSGAFVLFNQFSPKKLFWDFHPVKMLPFALMVALVVAVFYKTSPIFVDAPKEVASRTESFNHLKQILGMGFYLTVIGSFVMFGYGVKYYSHPRVSGRLVELEGNKAE